jgi:hypothetical protein
MIVDGEIVNNAEPYIIHIQPFRAEGLKMETVCLSVYPKR